MTDDLDVDLVDRTNREFLAQTEAMERMLAVSAPVPSGPAVVAPQQAAAGGAAGPSDEIGARVVRARGILERGEAIQFFRETFATLHSGDQAVLDTTLIAVTSQSIVNSGGIQPALAGPSGSGKTSGVAASLHLIPTDFMKAGSFSNKALFYHRIEPGTVFFSDDLTLNEEMQSLVKRCMSDFQSHTIHRTVSGDKREPKVITIPPRCVFIFTAVGDTGDDQLLNRQYRISLDKTPQRDEAFLQFELEKAGRGESDLPITEDVMVCRELINEIRAHLYRVIIPFAGLMRVPNLTNRRDVKNYLDFVKAVAVLHHLQRERREEGGETIVTAAPDDAHIARDLFRATEEGREHRLTKEELALWHLIAMMQKTGPYHNGVPEAEIVRESGKTKEAVHRLLHGRTDRGQGGLLAKVPRATVEKVTMEDFAGRRNQMNVLMVPEPGGIESYQGFVDLSRVARSPTVSRGLPEKGARTSGSGFPKENDIDNKIYNNNNGYPKTGKSSSQPLPEDPPDPSFADLGNSATRDLKGPIPPHSEENSPNGAEMAGTHPRAPRGDVRGNPARSGPP